MAGTEKKIAFATLDIGTSQIKLGVYAPFLSNKIILINNIESELIHGVGGEVRIYYERIREKTFTLFKELGVFVQKENIEALYIGICAHVSSLIEWNKRTGTPPTNPFPIWSDTTCSGSIDEYNIIMGNGKSKEIIGTFLPPGTNWLFTKLLHRRNTAVSDDTIFLQVGDAIFYELCGRYETHFSSQISMVDLRKRTYSQELLDHLRLGYNSFPLIKYDSAPVSAEGKRLYGLPKETYVFPAMADLYTSLYGLRLQDKEGFMLANTSEQAGAFYNHQPQLLDNFLNISFDGGYINYGSTNTGGNIVKWLLATVLKKEVNRELLNELTAAAALIPPEEVPVILPYLQGERAPLWNSKLTASILELNSSHTDVHLFRAILESVAFARRQSFEQIGMKELSLIKIGGGSSNNKLWNSIRATVINKPIAVADEKELAMAGLLYYQMEASKSAFAKPEINFSMIKPDEQLVQIYDEKYRRFIRYQQLLC